MAPEILNRVQYSSAKADIWSLGVLLFVMLEAKYPFLID
jgi:serine/threonine protein kinase